MSRFLQSRLVLAGVICCLLALVLLVRIPAGQDWVVTLMNSAHGPAFGAITLIILVMSGGRSHDPRGLGRTAVAAVLAAIGVGAAVELLQGMMGRDAEVQDVLNDALGAIAAAGFYVYCKTPAADRRKGVMPRATLVGATLASIFLLVPVVTSATAYLLQARRFPVLVDADAFLGSYFLRAYDGITVERAPLPLSMQAGLSDEMGFHVTKAKGPWALGFWETREDWRNKEFFVIRIANPTSQRLDLRLRFFDQRHERSRQNSFYSEVHFAPRGISTARVPLEEMSKATGRQNIDLSAMGGMMAYGPPVTDARGFYLIGMWLE